MSVLVAGTVANQMITFRITDTEVDAPAVS